MSYTLVDTKQIYHCSRVDIKAGGGLETYLSSLITSQMSGVSDRTISSLKNFDQQQAQLLHIHDPEILLDLREECPAILTLHNHSIYCVSGTKYLPNGNKVCDRIINPMGCTWGNLIDGCGTRRPHKIAYNWYYTYHALERLKQLKIPVIANSDYVRQEIINCGLAPERVVTLRCSVKPPQFPTAPLTPEIHQHQRLLFVGRIVPDKGVEWLIKALAHTHPGIHLDIAGDGWSKPSMETLADQMGLSDRITWHGWCNSEKLESLYQQCFSVVFPSLWPEPAGLVTLEAYSHYRPIIASAVGGIPEHVKDGKTGILVSPNNIKQLAAAINELAINYPQSRMMGEMGNAWYQEEFTIDIHIQKLAKIYAHTIAAFATRNTNNNSFDFCHI
jgi:glycosyltransferase involved in cell wall biosynthesis